MLDIFSRPVALLLILWIGQPPVPWGHAHADLQGPQLADHLQRHHASTAEADIPQGWHLHLLFPVLCGPGVGQNLAATECEISLEQRVGFHGPPPAWARAFERTNAIDGLLTVSCRTAAARAVFQQSLYQRLCMLLI